MFFLSAMPFLKNSPEYDVSYQHPLNSSSIINNTLPLATNESTTANDDVWTVKTLFPLTGSASICVATLFVFYFIRDCGKQKVNGGGSSPAATEEKEGEGVTKRGRLVLEIVVIALLSLMFFLYVGLEVAYGTFLTVFSVRSKLGRYLSHSNGTACSSVGDPDPQDPHVLGLQDPYLSVRSTDPASQKI
jgi:hypothetical protein